MLGTKTQEDYYLTRNNNFVPETPIDQAALDLLFKKAGKGKDQVWLGALRKYAKDSPSSCHTTINNWHAKLDKMVAQ